MPILQYSNWQNFAKIIDKAKISCEKSGISVFEHFTDVNKLSKCANNAGYKGLYNGETADDIAKRKELRYREDILDNMGSTELSANLFRISQTEEKLKKDNVQTEKDACNTHNKIGKIVRKAIKEAERHYARKFTNTSKEFKAIRKRK